VGYKKNTIMKTVVKKIRNQRASLTLIAIMGIALSLTSCKKSNTSAGLSAYLMITNSAQASTPQDFYLDNSKVNASAMAYSQSSGFIKTNTGDRQGQFKAAGSGSVETTINLSLSAGKYYSVFYTDGNSATTKEDDRTPPQSGKARVRFINLSSAFSSKIDIIAAGGASLVSDLAFKDASSYYDVDPASAFSLKLSGSSGTILNIPSAMQAGHIYTIYISGATSATVISNVIAEN
jgi:hypothetical protein